jgi:AhpD family alkylhydroperoxidase
VSEGTGPRLAPGTWRDVGPLNWVVAWVSGRVSGTGPLHLFLTLGRHKPLFRGWLHFAGRMMPGGKLPRRDTELVILRVAHLRSCTYEWEHHRNLSRRAGLTADDVAGVTTGPDAPGWSDRERAVLTAVDQLHADQDLTDAAWADLGRHLDDRQRLELVLLQGHYELLATTIATLRIEPDAHR